LAQVTLAEGGERRGRKYKPRHFSSHVGLHRPDEQIQD